MFILLMQDYRNIIESLPEDDRPEFFGLPANIARSSQRMISSQVKLHFHFSLNVFYIQYKMENATTCS